MKVGKGRREIRRHQNKIILSEENVTGYLLKSWFGFSEMVKDDDSAVYFHNVGLWFYDKKSDGNMIYKWKRSFYFVKVKLEVLFNATGYDRKNIKGNYVITWKFTFIMKSWFFSFSDKINSKKKK